MSQIEVLESQYGILVPLELVSTKINKDKAEKRFKACLFLLALDRKRYGHVLDELNNQHLLGANPYPTSVESVINMLTHRIDNRTHDYKNRGNIDSNSNNGPLPQSDDNDGTKNVKSFHQSHEDDKDDGSEGVTSFSAGQQRKGVSWWN